jgi:hypothetical protein
MPTLLNLVLRLVLLAAGLVFAVGVAGLVLLGCTAWALHFAWARLLGRPARRFQMPVRAKGSFHYNVRRGTLRPRDEDVTDVQVKSGS